jgi:hypothetical protein
LRAGIRSTGASPASESFLESNGSTNGLYLNANDSGSRIRFAVNATEIARFNGTGLGIGTTSPSNKLHVAGGAAYFAAGLRLAQRTDTGATVTVTTSDITVFCDATGAAQTANLPAASSMTGQILILKKIDSSANTVTLDPNSTETIDGSSTLVLSNQGDGVAIQSNGSNWYIVGVLMGVI